MRGSKVRYIGIDEVGRGPIAGPVAVGAVISFLPLPKINAMLLGIRDSKKAKESERQLWIQIARNMKKERHISYSVSFVSADIIDRIGITLSIQRALFSCLKKINATPNDRIFLDGGLHAPTHFKHQKTIIKGDTKIPLISLAATIAKVMRDEKMKKNARIYPKYGFEIHKGYGTKKHKQALKTHGVSKLHRKTFIKSAEKKLLSRRHSRSKRS